jgi:hypothetical protein
MPFRSRHQSAAVDFSQNEPQVEVAVGDVLDFLAANLAQISLVTSRHANSSTAVEFRL